MFELGAVSLLLIRSASVLTYLLDPRLTDRSGLRPETVAPLWYDSSGPKLEFTQYPLLLILILQRVWVGGCY